jgi:uncharacterized protein with ATP-grasp and redox domains
MRVEKRCYECFLKQAERALAVANASEEQKSKALQLINNKLSEISSQTIPIQFGKFVYDTVKSLTQNNDPYHKIKKNSTQIALKLYPHLQQRVKSSTHPLLTALKIAVSANIIDFGANHNFDIEKDILSLSQKQFAINHIDIFLDKLHNAKYILYLADNAGETVLDKLLIEELKKPVYYAVKSAPIINDATVEDAMDAGINKVAQIIESGSTHPGTILEQTNAEFQKLWREAPLIISKGQGNFEGLNEIKNENLFFLLTVKCKVIEEYLKVPLMSIILKSNG